MKAPGAFAPGALYLSDIKFVIENGFADEVHDGCR